MRSILAALALALGLSGPAFAESSITAYDAARQALVAIWADLPLTVRNVTITEGAATRYGDYTPAPDNTVTAGQPVHIYAEVLGYGWRDNGDGTLSERLEADLSLLDSARTTIASKQNFLSIDIRSRQKLLETFLTLDATLSAFAPGDYTLQYALRDTAGGKQTTFEVPIRLVGDGASSEPSAEPSSEPSSDASSQSP